MTRASLPARFALLVALLGSCLPWSELQTGSCGDGFVGREEACDDGNRVSGDGCSDGCRVEPPYCGDGRIDAGEDCDDANALDTDACVSGCREATCGDGKLWDVQEACDDGNGNDGDGCSASCAIEPPPVGPSCGDGALDVAEVCDDGNQTNTDTCANSCAWAACGDGLVREGVEECDDGNTLQKDGCSRACLRCGDSPESYFRPANGHCYTLHSDARPQSDARKACQAEGGDLWTATSQGEGRDVTANLMLSMRYWLGLQTKDTTRGWVTGEDTTYSNFAPGEPSTSAGKCVSMQREEAGSLWFSEACATALPYVCERAPAFIYPGNHHAFRLHTGALDAGSARQSCEASGGYLAMLETADERLFVGRNVDLPAWVDANDDAAEGQFVWANGSAVQTTDYAMGQPDDTTGSQGCLFLNAAERLADAACSDTRAYLCELE